MLIRDRLSSPTPWCMLAIAVGACSSQSIIAITVPDGAPQIDAPSSSGQVVDGGIDGGQILFSDNFEDGLNNWLLPGSSDGPVTAVDDGTNRFLTFDSSNSSFTRIRTNLNGSFFTASDITASMQVRIEQATGPTRTVRLDVRQSASSENIFYAVGVTVLSGGSVSKVGLFKKVNVGSGNYTLALLASSTLATPIAAGQWMSLKVTVIGDSSVALTGFLGDSELVSYTDDCVSSLTSTAGDTVPNGGCLADQTGLGIQVEGGIQASIDDVLVERP